MISASTGWSQLYFTALEAGVSGGVSQYFGDLNEHYGFKTIHAAGGIMVRRRLNSYISAKLVANYTNVSYDDKLTNVPYQLERNLNFKSTVVEFALQAEFNFFSYITGDKEHRWTPYLTGGIGMFYYDPYTDYNGGKVYLRPLGTEGQFAGYSSRKYSNTSICFPVGAGVKFWLKGGVNLGLEIADRLTTTDYLDDVSSTYVGIKSFKQNPVAAALQDRSPEVNENLGQPGKQRGNTASYDQYLMVMLSVTFNFTSYRCPRFMGEEDELRKK
jgi:hypothetical protein